MPVGLPYNNNNPRPVKNGQPPPCNLPQCNGTFAGRKVGAAMKRLPQLYYGDKAKEQILQKWDPATKSMVNIHGPIEISSCHIVSVTPDILNVQIQATRVLDVVINVYASDTNNFSNASLVSSTSKIITYTSSVYSIPGTYDRIKYYYIQILQKYDGKLFSSDNNIRYDIYITTIAGNDGILNNPNGVAVDSSGNIYIADTSNNRIRKVTPGGSITTVAGGGDTFGDGGPATSAQLSSPYGVAVDSSGNIYIADTINHRIRKVTPGGIITTVAGNGSLGFSGDGGPATSAQLQSPLGVAVDSAGNIYIADADNNRIRKVTPGGIITTVAGDGTLAILKEPSGLVVDYAGNIYIADAGNKRIRKVTPGGSITTVAGGGESLGDGGPATSALLQNPYGVALDPAGNIYIADTGNSRIRKVTTSTGIITTVAGNGSLGFSGDGGPAISSRLYNPFGVAVDSAGNIYIADTVNNRIRKCYLVNY